MHTKPRLIIHGGAGAITRSNLSPSSYALYASALLSLNRQTSHLLSTGTTALDAATYAVSILEDNPLFNCGKGAVFARDGTIELEASVMVSRGYRKRGCGVVGVTRVRHPILLAREMLVRGEVDGGGGDNGGDGDPSGGGGGAQGHCVLGGKTVERLAEEWGLDIVDEKWFWTRKRWEQHKKGLEGKGSSGEAVKEWEEKVGRVFDGEGEGWDGREYLPQGTVGCVVLDRYGTLCVATSTGGLTNKLPGRIGDTPTIGAGFWAEEWEVPRPVIHRQPEARSPLAAMLPQSLRQVVNDCIPGLSGYAAESHYGFPRDEKRKSDGIQAVAMSGTGNGDSFLRLAAVRTAGAIVRFSPDRSLSSAVSQIAGSGGELQRSAGDRWGKTGEGEGGIIGIELVGGKGKIVSDFNCGGMFRTWVDDEGEEKVMVFKEEY